MHASKIEGARDGRPPAGRTQTSIGLPGSSYAHGPATIKVPTQPSSEEGSTPRWARQQPAPSSRRPRTGRMRTPRTTPGCFEATGGTPHGAPGREHNCSSGDAGAAEGAARPDVYLTSPWPRVHLAPGTAAQVELLEGRGGVKAGERAAYSDPHGFDWELERARTRLEPALRIRSTR